MALQEQLDKKKRELAPHFKPGFLQRDSAIFQFIFERGEPFHLEVNRAGFALRAGRSDAATLTLHVDSHKTCWGLLSGRIDGMAAFMDGRYRADGNIVLSQLLLYMFRVDDPTVPYRVQD